MSDIIKGKDNDPIIKWVDSTLAANRGKEFVKRMFEKKPKSIPDPEEQGFYMTHKMEVSDGLAYPRVVNINGRLTYLSSSEAYDYAKKTGEYIKFKNDDEAVKFTQNYKRGNKVTIGK
jgi:hypothetical protein